MKISTTPTLSVAVLLAAAFSLKAADYTLHMDSSYPWNTAPWQVEGSPAVPPGASDSVIDITTDGTVRDLYLNGNQDLVNLTKTGTGSYRIYNGHSSSNIDDSALTLSGTFRHSAATVYIRSNPNGGRLELDLQNFTIGHDTSVARVRVGENTNTTYQRVTLNVQGITRITGNNAALEFSEGLSNTETSINLGHVVFDNLSSTGSPGIEIGSGIVHVKSLNSSATSGGSIRTTTTGTGTLRIGGDAGDPLQPEGPATFYSPITGGVRLEKTGSNIQILSPHSGQANTYKGGTLISGGVLSVRSSPGGSALGSGAVEVASGGTLAGNGGIVLGAGNAVTVRAGGVIAPGADGLGMNTLVVNGYNSFETEGAKILKMESGSSFSFNVDSEGNSDKVMLAYYRSGALELEGGAITVNITGQLNDAHVYSLFEFKSGGPGGGALVNSGLTGGLVAGSGFEGYDVQFHYDETGFGGVGIVSMTVTVIPEGKVAWLVPLGLGIVIAFRKGRRSIRQEAR